jgi:osmoprotectant transport system substrate-binding protein
VAGHRIAGCGGPRAGHGGLANFAESSLLADVYAQALEAKGCRVTRRFNLGDRETYYEQVRSGQIDVIPEYNGRPGRRPRPVQRATTTAQVNKLLAQVLPSQLQLLNPAAAEDKDTVTVTKKTADRYGLRTIADLKPVDHDIVLGGSREFETRQPGQGRLTRHLRAGLPRLPAVRDR